MLGKLLGKVVRVVNAPLRAIETIADPDNAPNDERIVSAPLEKLAQALDKVDAEDE